MNLIGVSGGQEIIEHLVKFPLTESRSYPNFQIKEEFNPNCFYESEQNIFLGLDHSITLPVVKEWVRKYQNPGIVVFDAHPDCCGIEDLVPGLINQNLIKKENIVLVGLRNWTVSELNFLKQNQIKYFTMSEIALEGKFEVSESVMSIARQFDGLYISIDADVIDPAFVSVDTPEPGGLTVRELLFFIHRLKKLKNFKAADLCELKPESSLVGAKLVVELMG